MDPDQKARPTTPVEYDDNYKHPNIPKSIVVPAYDSPELSPKKSMYGRRPTEMPD